MSARLEWRSFVRLLFHYHDMLLLPRIVRITALDLICLGLRIQDIAVGGRCFEPATLLGEWSLLLLR